MPIQNFINFLKLKGDINNNDIENIKKYVCILDVNKNEILINSGKICDKLFFIHKGLLRAYHTNEKGLEVTRLICKENEFCTNLSSFKNLSISNETIQAIENSKILLITQKDFYNLINISSNLYKIYVDILEEFQSFNHYRLEFVTSYQPTEKLIIFKAKYPDIFKRINNKILASYLCLTPETCSRIKKT
jgi:CRP-like cAMP-binding protein